ncbi:DNA cytosine methyltransferase [Brevundimonas sp. SH203]|uniref:DNA cytosine methyltransferase n=1 Tax=Brevundimonas sp. SH203 TaxID=345167 RepID=UPI0013566CD8|nr:DNA cytosine methyltransferase [Brevundimonas sp. SH203]
MSEQHRSVLLDDTELDSAGSARRPTFVDAFAGCGGLSLGLKRAGWHGIFAIEKDAFAFSTLTKNFPDGGELSYSWPQSIERKAWDIQELLSQKKDQLSALSGTIDLLAGGPPCQGFSHAGRRKAEDPRNRLFEAYLDLVSLIKPRIVLIENVRGFQSDFGNAASGEITNFAESLKERLGKEYHTQQKMIRVSEYGVPQARQRFFLIGGRIGDIAPSEVSSVFDALSNGRDQFLNAKGLTKSPSARDALSDLEVAFSGTKPCPDSPGFRAISYKGPRTDFQRAMRDDFTGDPSDTRLARHRPDIETRFAAIIKAAGEEGRLNTTISAETRKKYSLKKMAIRVLDPLAASPTITSLPDDLLHYSEPRTLTVRENARLQTFPDWFQFHGKYTTGGHLRRVQVPRFTQVANAVPPILAEQVGSILYRLACGTPLEIGVQGLADDTERTAMIPELTPELDHPFIVDDGRILALLD